MKTKPILFSGPMVRALLDGSKTQTRRVVKYDIRGPSEPMDTFDWYDKTGKWVGAHGRSYPFKKTNAALLCPYGQPGDRLWVRETWQGPLLQEFEMDADPDWYRASNIHQYQSPKHCEYAADGGPKPEYMDTDDVMRQGWRPSIHMPRWASRITLEVTGVRVERMQDISVADALAEGVNVHPYHHNRPRTSRYSPVQACRDLWEQINGPSSWDANPWVWVVEFKRVEGFAA